jgi:hypothetical protein
MPRAVAMRLERDRHVRAHDVRAVDDRHTVGDDVKWPSRAADRPIRRWRGWTTLYRRAQTENRSPCDHRLRDARHDSA